MADFSTAYTITILGNEGGYNPGKCEAETYRGIDRSIHPTWTGWDIIDNIKEGKNVAQINNLLASNTQFQKLIKAFYQTNYWNTISLTEINNQQVANILFDDSVNCCEISVAKVMQQAVNLCNVQPPIVIDGQVGAKTITAINSLNPELYYNAVVSIRKFHYQHAAMIHPSLKMWAPIWLARLKPFKHA